jgi:hypothetical protein
VALRSRFSGWTSLVTVGVGTAAVAVGSTLLLHTPYPDLAVLSWVLMGAIVGVYGIATTGRVPDHVRPKPVVPDGVVAPPGRTYAVDFPDHIDARVSLAVKGAPDLFLERAAHVSDLEAFFRRPGPGETGDAEFDQRFHLEGARIDRDARRSLQSIFDEFKASRVESKDGRLTASVPLERLAHAESYTLLLEYLDKAARTLERVVLDVKVLGGERKALVGGAHGAARCSYCHGEVTGSEPDLVACGECSTVLHEGCWAELGHCPVLGCRSKTPERARTS